MSVIRKKKKASMDDRKIEIIKECIDAIWDDLKSDEVDYAFEEWLADFDPDEVTTGGERMWYSHPDLYEWDDFHYAVVECVKAHPEDFRIFEDEHEVWNLIDEVEELYDLKAKFFGEVSDEVNKKIENYLSENGFDWTYHNMGTDHPYIMIYRVKGRTASKRRRRLSAAKRAALERIKRKVGKKVRKASDKCSEIEKLVDKHGKELAEDGWIFGDVEDTLRESLEMAESYTPEDLVMAWMDSWEETEQFRILHYNPLIDDLYDWAKRNFDKPESSFCCPYEFIDTALWELCNTDIREVVYEMWEAAFSYHPFNIYEKAREILDRIRKSASTRRIIKKVSSFESSFLILAKKEFDYPRVACECEPVEVISDEYEPRCEKYTTPPEHSTAYITVSSIGGKITYGFYVKLPGKDNPTLIAAGDEFDELAEHIQARVGLNHCLRDYIEREVSWALEKIEEFKRRRR